MRNRIKQLMEHEHMNQKAFADCTGINGATLSSIFNGRTSPTLNTVEAIRNKFPKVNVEWLLFGKGEMFTSAEGNSNISSETSNDQQQNLQAGSSDANTFASGMNVSAQNQNSLFSQPQNVSAQNNIPQQYHNNSNLASEQNLFNNVQPRQQAQRNNISIEPVIQYEQAQRKITEIRIFYDDQTWECFVPKDSNQKK